MAHQPLYTRGGDGPLTFAQVNEIGAPSLEIAGELLLPELWHGSIANGFHYPEPSAGYPFIATASPEHDVVIVNTFDSQKREL
jgi:hypothetical protein